MDQARDVTAAFTLFQPNLTIAKSHRGNVRSGRHRLVHHHASRTSAPIASYGGVTVAENPPADLSITGMSGTGWTCDVPTATCTRSDALANGAAYPDITVDVSVSGNAAASITNLASVSGGGDVDLSNNDASDPTTIDPQQFPLTVDVTGSGSVDADTRRGLGLHRARAAPAATTTTTARSSR